MENDYTSLTMNAPRIAIKLTKNLSLFLLLSVLLITGIQAFGQSGTGTISGKVTDNNSEPLEHVSVSIEGKGNASTNEAGEFTLSAPAGNHQLLISHVGFERRSIKINIEAGESRSVNTIMLQPQGNDLKELTIEGKTAAKNIKDQAFNVNVISAKQLYNTSSDLNRALNSTSGIRVREEGGVGSNFSFSLNGFSGKQVKFFLDGIPMDNFGSSLTLNNFPSNMAERVEVYKGVLPIHLGADALGGAINVVTRSNPNFLDIAYGLGSFNTHRASVNHAYTNAKSGFTVRTNAFYNFSDNSYKVKVSPRTLSLTGGSEILPAREVERFHDGYESATIQVEAGVTSKRYADKLLIGLIASGNDKDIQTGVTMDQVYGARTSDVSTVIPTLKYSKSDLFTQGLDLTFYSAYNLSTNNFIDTTRLNYNWLQETIPSTTAEEIRSQRKNKDKEGLITANLAYALNQNHSISFNYVMSNFRRKSSDIEDPGNITFNYPQELGKQIMGLAWQTNYENFTATVFSKLYLLNASSYNRVTNGTAVASYEASSTKTNDLGYGAAAAYFIIPGLQAKASFEHTYRLPEAVELLGDGLFTRANADLIPESSNNINLGALYAFTLNTSHKLSLEANYIFRNSQDYIRLDQAQNQPIDRQYINIGDVRTNGVEGDVRYSWNDRLHAGINVTYQNIIDKEKFRSSTNLTGTTLFPNLGYGYRIPNMPFLFANADLGYTFHNLGADKNTFNINYSVNFVEKYYLTPSHLGLNNTDDIPRQVAHNIMANYTVKGGKYNVSIECRNFTDNNLFDNFRLQKPGRSFNVKLRYFISK